MTVETRPTETAMPLLRLLAYWRIKYLRRRTLDGGLPARADIEPERLKEILPNLFILEVKGAPVGPGELPQGPVVWRLAGTGVVGFLGSDPTGKALDDCAAETLRRGLVRATGLALGHRRPVTCTGLERMPWRYGVPESGRQARFEVAIAPLARDGRRIDMLIGVLSFTTAQRPDTTGPREPACQVV
ncbi:MAG: PAS domain-containing protein [Azospirillaceae bacterium]